MMDKGLFRDLNRMFDALPAGEMRVLFHSIVWFVHDSANPKVDSTVRTWSKHLFDSGKLYYVDQA